MFKNTQNDNLRAATYLRVSTEDQVSGYGLDVQRERCKAQIVAKGWELVGEYTDEGISGTKDESKRPALAQMLQDAAAGKFNAVVILALDRLGRKTNIVLSLVEKLTQANVAIVSCKESLDTATPQGQFVLTMFAALAQLERDLIVERTTAGRNIRGKRDGEKGGRMPLGYIRVPEVGYAVEPDDAMIVRNIFAWRRFGLSLRAIAEMLNSQGITTKRGHIWHHTSVRAVLNNEDAYRGGFRGESQVEWVRIL